MQEVQEKEINNQDPSDLVMSKRPSTVSRISERLVFLKHAFRRTRTPRTVDFINEPYCNY